MKCLHPIELSRDTVKGKVIVPCGNCPVCLSNRRNQWAFRLEQEFKRAPSGYFITLTYDEKKIPLNVDDDGVVYMTLYKKDVQKFMKRLRKKFQNMKETYQSIGDKRQNEFIPLKYFCVGEYGDKFSRPHYHMLLFNIPQFLSKEMVSNIILKEWQNGLIDVGDVTPASIRYTCKYLLKEIVVPDGGDKIFSLISHGIGIEYIDKLKRWHELTKNFYGVSVNGTKVSLPRYYRDKIFSDHDKDVNNEKSKGKRHVKDMEEEDRLRGTGEDVSLYFIELEKSVVRRFKNLKNLKK